MVYLRISVRAYLILELDLSIVVFVVVSWDTLKLDKISLHSVWYSSWTTYNIEFLQWLADNPDGLPDIFLTDDQRRGKSNTDGTSAACRGHHLERKTHMLTWVGLANKPLLFINKHNCQAVLPFLDWLSSITTPLNRPRPRIILINGDLRSASPALKISPRRWDRSARFSRSSTSRAVIATAHPRGLLSYQLGPAICSRAFSLPSVCWSVLSWLDAEHDLLAR